MLTAHLPAVPYRNTPQSLGEEPFTPRIRKPGESPRITTPAETLAFIKAERADFSAIAKARKLSME